MTGSYRPAAGVAEGDLNGIEVSTDSPGDEEDLVRRAAAGDRLAFGELYDRHVDAVYRYAYYRLRTEVEAEDVTSDVFRRALGAMPRYEPRRPFLAFLYGIARRAVADVGRARRPASPLEDAAELASGRPGPEELALRTDAADRVRAALAKLTPLQQEIVILRFIEDRTPKEIAAITGKTESTVRGIQMRALTALRGLLTLGEARVG